MSGSFTDKAFANNECQLNNSDNRLMFDTTVLRCIAVILIVNSHLENYYPISWLAEGGLLGNSFFFFVSGVGLGLSNKSKTQSFGQWYWQRLIRIYPAVWVCLIPFVVLKTTTGHYTTPSNFWTYFNKLIWPINGYHFISKILVFYIGIYAIKKWQYFKKYPIIFTSLALIFTVVLVPEINKTNNPLSLGKVSPHVRWIYYAIVTAIGLCIGEKKWETSPKNTIHIMTLVSCSLLYGALKYLMVIKGLLTPAFPILYLLTIGICWSLFEILRKPKIQSITLKKPIPLFVFTSVSLISLEVYLIHMQILHWGPWPDLTFPINILSFSIITLILSHLANKIVLRIIRPKN